MSRDLKVKVIDIEVTVHGRGNKNNNETPVKMSHVGYIPFDLLRMFLGKAIFQHLIDTAQHDIDEQRLCFADPKANRKFINTVGLFLVVKKNQ